RNAITAAPRFRQELYHGPCLATQTSRVPQRFVDKPLLRGINQPNMASVFTHLLLLAMTLIQTPANPAADKGVITGRLLTIDGTPAIALRVMAMAVTEPAPT